jgi:hypothetical protein
MQGGSTFQSSQQRHPLSFLETNNVNKTHHILSSIGTSF